MSKVYMPRGPDIEQVIEGLGLFDSDQLTTLFEFLETETLAGAAVRQFEEETGWIPFLADVDILNADQVRYYDPPGPNGSPWILGGGFNLELAAGLVTLTTVHTGYSATEAGTAQAAGTDFYLYPYNADGLDRPWTALHFRVPQWGLRQSIKVTGRFGYAQTVPDDVWLAIAHHGAFLALPQIQEQFTGGVEQFTEAGVTEKYGPTFLTGDAGAGGRWAMEWERIIRRYRRVML